jgi:hypothetical protein
MASAGRKREVGGAEQGGRRVTRESHMDNGGQPSPVFPFPLPGKSIGEEKAKVKRRVFKA